MERDRDAHVNLTREEIANLEVGHTDVPPGLARLMLGVFLAFITAVAAAELEQAVTAEHTPPWSRLTEVPAAARRAPGWLAKNRAVLERLHAFERSLEDQSRIGQLLRPRVQTVLAQTAGVGNEQVYVGRGGWLFYRPDVEYLTSPGFMNARVRRRRENAADEWARRPETDPVRAIVEFARELQAQGISLILVPVPVKPTIHPDMLSRSYAAAGQPPHNPDYLPLIHRLEREGLRIVDPTGTLHVARRTSATSQYLSTDTHWRPEAMELVAEQVTRTIAETAALPPVPGPGYRTMSVDVTHLGDIFTMLDLPADQRLFAPETVTIRRVLSADGSPWRPDRTADVLLLGDSFTNIYSLESMGWGTGAGFAEQLSYVLARPLDRIVQNDAGAHATRELLRREPERLTGKKVVIWQFAARELAFGDWKN